MIKQWYIKRIILCKWLLIHSITLTLKNYPNKKVLTCHLSAWFDLSVLSIPAFLESNYPVLRKEYQAKWISWITVYIDVLGPQDLNGLSYRKKYINWMLLEKLTNMSSSLPLHLVISLFFVSELWTSSYVT